MLSRSSSKPPKPGRSAMAKSSSQMSKKRFAFGLKKKENKLSRLKHQRSPPMKKLFLSILLLAGQATSPMLCPAADAPAPKRAEPTLEQRVADLEAYVNNGARVADGTNNVFSKLGSYDDKSN